MGLFQRNPHRQTEQAAIYRTGKEKTIMIIGLGNVGQKYTKTRHNAGFIAVDAFAEALEFPKWQEKKAIKSFVTIKVIGDTQVILLKPQTMMNLSGQAVQAAAHYYKIKEPEILVVYDELAIPFGQIRLRTGGSAGGHNGIKSVLEHLQENFGRVRIGVKSDTETAKKMDSSDFVLANFTKEEQGQLPAMTREVNSILTEYIYGGVLNSDTRSFIV